MDLTKNSMTNLFRQLGLPSTPQDITAFVEKNRPLPEGVMLADASFWNPGQAQFLREEILEDADWAEVVDQLSVMLRP